MHKRASTWFLLTAVLGVVGLFVLHGVASGVVLALAFVTVMTGFIRGLAGEHPDDFPAASGFIGHWL
jgi:hypothetical protein